MAAPSSPDAPRIAASLRAALGAFRLEIDLDVPARGITAIFGPSGAGKTACLRAIAGLDRARGALRVGGETWQDDARGVFVPAHARGVGYVFQDARLFPHLTVRGNLAYGRARRPSPALLDVQRAVELLGLGDLLGRRPAHLSGGERQRVALARALVAGPRLLLMDEPLASLDPARKAEVLPYLERLRDEVAVPVLYVSHALDEVARLAGHLVLLDAGRAIASGPLGETLARLDLPTASLEDAGVVVDAEVVDHDDVDRLTRLDAGGATLWVARLDRPAGARVRARILARDVSLSRDLPGASSVVNVVPARVEAVRDDGPSRVNVRLSFGARRAPLLARVTRRSRTALGLEPGAEAYAMVKGVSIAT